MLGLDLQSSARPERVRTVSGRSLRRAEPDVRQTGGAIPGGEHLRCGTQALPGCTAAPLGRTAMSLEARRPDSLARTRPPGAANLRPSGLRVALPEVGDARGGRDRMHARTRWAPRSCSRSRIAFSRRTSRKGARNKPQTISCQAEHRRRSWEKVTARTSSRKDTLRSPGSPRPPWLSRTGRT